MLLSVHLKPIALMLALVLLAGGRCAAATPSPPEELIAAEPTTAGITITVPTGGCTSKDDFEVSSSPLKDGQASLEFHRLFRDTCKGNFPDGLKLQFTWAELKLPEGTKLSVKNPLEPPFNPPVTIKPAAPSHDPVSARPGQHRHARPASLHRHRHRHKRPSTKVHARAHRHAFIHTHRLGSRYCHEYPHSRQCRHLRHARVRRHRHRVHCR